MSKRSGHPRKPKGVVVCVGYDDLLAVTLPTILPHVESLTVVTDFDDRRTAALVKQAQRCGGTVELLCTDAFYRHGAVFNKGLAIEEAFDFIGRSGWILVLDADILLPPAMGALDVRRLNPAVLYGAPRRICDPPEAYRSDKPWGKYPAGKDKEHAGYFQLFHASAPSIAEQPWYDVHFTHAGGGDGYFQSRFPAQRKAYLPFEVLHLGPRDQNWFGRVTPRLDGALVEGAARARTLMRSFLGWKGWVRTGVRPSSFDERVEVPGYRKTGWKLGKN